MPRLPKATTEKKPLPEQTVAAVPVPEPNTETIPNPQIGIPENTVKFGDTYVEIKPTKLKYQRDRTAAFYRLLKQASIVEPLALQDGVLDTQRSSDKMLFDWLIAVTDDPKLVTANYDEIDSETIYKLLEIFCRLNHIKDEDEKAKKEQAQMTTR